MGLSDILTTVQQGVTAVNNCAAQLNGSLLNIQTRLNAISSTSSGVISFNGRSGAVTPAQGDYPTSLIPGSTTNNNASAGNLGEYISATTGSAAVTSSVASLGSISLSAGDWDVTGTIDYVTSATTSANLFFRSGISTSSNSNNLGAGTTLDVASVNPTITFAVSDINIPCATVRLSIAGTTTVFLNALAIFGTGSITASGFIRARRPR